jgi:membrane protease YdiL (CAAX protease family)
MVVVTMPIVFLGLAEAFGDRAGWLLGFLIYWVVWGFGFPLWLLGGGRVWELLRTTPRRPGLLWSLLLLGPPVGSLVMGWVPVSELSVGAVVVAVGFALVNGTAEELLWRGVFITLFPSQWWWGLVYPSFAFGLWHLAPQIIDPAEGGPIPFAVAAVFLGLLYGLVARHTGSVRWPAISHIFADLLALETFVDLVG